MRLHKSTFFILVFSSFFATSSGIAVSVQPQAWPLISSPPSPEHMTLIENITALFAPLAREQGGILRAVHDPFDTSATASAHRDRLDDLVIRTTGGLLNHPNLDTETLRFLLCHELGHLFGGLPHRPAPPEWPHVVDEDGNMILSAEGQADYWAGLVCMPLALANENNVAHVKTQLIPQVVREKCSAATLTTANATTANINTKAYNNASAKPTRHHEDEIAAICMRTAVAGFAMLRLVYPFPISLETPSTDLPEKTIADSYPSRQCRLDTIFAAAQGQPRPRCWFKP